MSQPLLMRPGSFRHLARRSLHLVLLLPAVIAGCSKEDQWLLAPKRIAIQESSADSGKYDLVLVHTIGEGTLADSRGSIAVSPSGRLAVEETAECRVSVFRISDAALLYRVGRCGGGPGEIKAAVSLVFVGDTLLVGDVGLRAISRFDPQGHYVGRDPLSGLWGEEAIDLGTMTRLGESRLVAIRRTRALDEPQIAVLDRRTGMVSGRFLQQPSAVRKGGRVQDLGVKLCGADWSNGPMVVATGMYQFEALAMTPDGGLHWRSHTPLDWLTAVSHNDEIAPSAFLLRPLCGTDGVILRASRVAPWAKVDAPLEGGVIEVRDVTGTLLSRKLVSTDDETWFRPGGGWKDLWAFDDATSALPRIRVYRLTKRG